MFAFCSQCHHLAVFVLSLSFCWNIFEPLGYALIFLFLCSSVKLWASAFGGEIKSISAKYSGSQLLQKVPISQCCASQTVFFLLSDGHVVTTIIHCKAVFPLWRLQRHLVVAAECWCVILEETQVCFSETELCACVRVCMCVCTWHSPLTTALIPLSSHLSS